MYKFEYLTHVVYKRWRNTVIHIFFYSIFNISLASSYDYAMDSGYHLMIIRWTIQVYKKIK